MDDSPPCTGSSCTSSRGTPAHSTLPKHRGQAWPG
jgi:hypothetical protein